MGQTDPRSDAACTAVGYPPGYVEVGSSFGFTARHVFAGAEQRAFIQAQLAPEPATVVPVLTALVPLGVIARRRRSA